MSIAKITRVDHARQRFEKVAKTDESGSAVRTPVMSRRTGEQKAGRGGRPMTRRQTVADKTKPLPNYTCGKCRVEIKPGDPYLWYSVGFRSHHKSVRCTKTECFPKDSERESSKLAAVYAAREDAEATIAAATESDDIEQAVQSVGESCREVAEEYREASVNPNTGSVFNTSAEEKADELDSAADEVDGWSHSQDMEAPACSEHDENEEECEDCQSEKDAWLDSIREEATEAISNISV